MEKGSYNRFCGSRGNPFFTAWLSFTAVSLTELTSITLLSFLQLALAFFYSYENTKNQRETLRKHSQESVFKKENLRLSERIKKIKEKRIRTI